ncbi:MAG: glycosyltransferase family 1 protein [Candidatus Shapirobacteria bacterium]|jgi:glycosyltransferase involved in cell wall biosynthesis
MKHLVIDARLYGSTHTGIGRYTKNLLVALTKIPDFQKVKTTLIVYPELLDEIKKDLGTNFSYVITNIRHYSLQEQLFLPFLLYRLKPNLVHFTHFNKPLLYFGKSLVTIHDLIKHFFHGRQATTKNSFMYWPKYLAYLLVTHIVIKTSAIIVPSNFWRNYLIKNYHVSPKDITTTYEAVDPKFITNYGLPITNYKNYILYTGNLYPHKNIRIVIEALKKIPDLKLKIICARSIFSQRAQRLIQKYQIEQQVEFLGYVPDSDFKNIYQHALALVHPSLMEGFSLTGLEAMALNCPVISSNASCLPEIYGDKSVLYFDPYDPDDLVIKIQQLRSSDRLRQKLIKWGHLQVAKYSWSKTAIQTLDLYSKILSTK